MQDPVKLKALYDGLKANKYIKGMPDSYEAFESAMLDGTKREAFFNGISQNKYIKGLPDNIEQFNQGLGFGKKKEDTPLPSDPSGDGLPQIPLSNGEEQSAGMRPVRDVAMEGSSANEIGEYLQGYAKGKGGSSVPVKEVEATGMRPVKDLAEEEIRYEQLLKNLQEDKPLSQGQAQEAMMMAPPKVEEMAPIKQVALKQLQEEVIAKQAEENRKGVNDLKKEYGLDPEKPFELSDLINAPKYAAGVGAKSIWNFSTTTLPASLAMTASNLIGLEKKVKQKIRGLFGQKGISESDLFANETQKELLKYSLEKEKEGELGSKGLVTSYKDVDSPLSALNYIVQTGAQSIPQLAATYLSGGTTSIAQEVGSIYMDSIKKIASEKGITEAEVIDKGLDNPAITASFGLAAGLVDRLGADKVWNDAFRKELRKELRGKGLLTFLNSANTEGVTEGVQTVIEEIGSNMGSGKNFEEAVNEAVKDKDKLIDAYLGGAIGGATISGAGSAIDAVTGKVLPESSDTPINPNQIPDEPIAETTSPAPTPDPQGNPPVIEQQDIPAIQEPGAASDGDSQNPPALPEETVDATTEKSSKNIEPESKSKEGDLTSRATNSDLVNNGSNNSEGLGLNSKNETFGTLNASGSIQRGSVGVEQKKGAIPIQRLSDNTYEAPIGGVMPSAIVSEPTTSKAFEVMGLGFGDYEITKRARFDSEGRLTERGQISPKKENLTPDKKSTVSEKARVAGANYTLSPEEQRQIAEPVKPEEKPVTEELAVKPTGKEKPKESEKPNAMPEKAAEESKPLEKPPTETLKAKIDRTNKERKRFSDREDVSEKEADKYFAQVDRLVDPVIKDVVEYRKNGIVVKEGNDFVFLPLMDKGLPSWTLSGEKYNVNDQFQDKKATPPTERKTKVQEEIKQANDAGLSRDQTAGLRMADKVLGKARENAPKLTDAHENELYQEIKANNTVKSGGKDYKVNWTNDGLEVKGANGKSIGKDTPLYKSVVSTYKKNVNKIVNQAVVKSNEIDFKQDQPLFKAGEVVGSRLAKLKTDQKKVAANLRKFAKKKGRVKSEEQKILEREYARLDREIVKEIEKRDGKAPVEKKDEKPTTPNKGGLKARFKPESLQDRIADELSNGVDSEGITRMLGKNRTKDDKGILLSYANNSKGRKIDVIASQLASEFGTDAKTVMDAMEEFMMNNPTPWNYIEKRVAEQEDPVAAFNDYMEQSGQFDENLWQEWLEENDRQTYEALVEEYLENEQIANQQLAEEYGKQETSRTSGQEAKGSQRGSVEKEPTSRDNADDDGSDSTEQGDGKGVSPKTRAFKRGKGSRGVGAFERRSKSGEGSKNFKLYQKVIDIIRKYNPLAPIMQGRTSKGSIGTYFTKNGTVAVNGYNNIDTAFHELAHALDDKFKVISSFIRDTKAKDPLRVQLTDIYEEFYPGAQRNHPLPLRMIEGYAVLMQNYISNPSLMEANYPDLVDTFIRPGGKYSFPKINEFLDDASDMVAEYQGLSDTDKMLAKIVDEVRTNPERKGRKKAKYEMDRAVREIADDLRFMENAMKEAGMHYTPDDVTQQMRMARATWQRANQNIEGSGGEIWMYSSDGSLKKVSGSNYHTLDQSLKKLGKEKGFEAEREFDAFLFARRLYEEFKYLQGLITQRDSVQDELDTKKERLEMLEQQSNDPNDNLAEKLDLSQDIAILSSKLSDLKDQVKEMQSILKKDMVLDDDDQLTEESIERVYLQGKEDFKDQEKIYDDIKKHEIEALFNARLIDADKKDELLSREGYTPFKRQFYNEILGEEVSEKSGRLQSKGATDNRGVSNVSGLRRRTGGSQPVLSPLLASKYQHQEVMTRTAQQHVYNMLYDNRDKLSKVLDISLVAVPDGSGKMALPQSKDKNIFFARTPEGKLAPMLIQDEDMASVLTETLSPESTPLLFRILQLPNQIWKAGTTGLFPPFILAQLTMDSATAAMQSKTGIIPFISPAKELGRAIMVDGPERQYWKEYIATSGFLQTRIGFDRTDWRDYGKKSSGLNRKAHMVVNALNTAMHYISLPGTYAEITNRATEYIRARKQGDDMKVAKEKAGAVTAPFHHKGRFGGKVGQGLVRSMAYTPAVIAALAQSIRVLHTEKGRKRFILTASALAASTAASTMYMLSSDDEELKDLLLSKNPEELSKYLFLPNPFGKGQAIKLRIPEQVGFLSGLVNMAMLEAIEDADYKASEYVNMLGTPLPDQVKLWEVERAAYSLLPQAIKPVTEAYFNRKTYPTVRDIDTPYEMGKSPRFRYNEWNSPVAIEMAKHLEGMLEISPKKIDHLITGYLGRTANMVTGKPGYGPLEAFNRQFVSTLYMNASRPVQEYYRIQVKNNQLLGDLKNKDREMTSSERRKVLEIKNSTDRISKLLSRYDKIDVDREPKRADDYREAIFKEITALRELEDK
jgi:hypothetical protein